MPDDAVIITFPKINKRAPNPRLTVNYEIAADNTGATTGAWVLTERNSTTAVREGIEIGAISGKIVDEKGFGRFYADNGIPVREITGTKVIRTPYFIRIAPKQEGSTFTAASKVRKITVLSQSKAPTYKPSKTGKVTVRKGTSVKWTNGEITVHSDKTVFDSPLHGSPDGVLVWTNATAKKPASKQQVLTVGKDSVTLYLKIGDRTLTAALEDNSATQALRQQLAENPITINMSDYGGFEKVGDFGMSFPTSDRRITAKSGDLILYQGNQFVIFYGSNTWSYTRLGKINNVTQQELRNILGSGNVTVILSLNQD
jgi:hypothetical protein